MKHLSLFILLALSVAFYKARSNYSFINTITTLNDTTIGSKVVTNELAGSAYRKRGKLYFTIVNNDTSAFKCFFQEPKEDGKVGIDIHFENTKSYRQRMEELKKILPEALKDFKPGSLNSLYFGRLALNTDLSIAITKQYREKFGTSNKIVDYNKFSQFLSVSKLASDINELFKPYSISVDKIYSEKIFFTSVYKSSKTETPAADIPDKILDCTISIKLKRDHIQ